MRLIATQHIVHGAAKHRLGNAARGRLDQRLADVIELFTFVEVERLTKEGFLVAECSVKARPSDPHRFSEIVQGSAFIALFPKDSERLRKSVINAKFARAATGGNDFGFIHIARYIMPFAKKSIGYFTEAGSAAMGVVMAL